VSKLRWEVIRFTLCIAARWQRIVDTSDMMVFLPLPIVYAVSNNKNKGFEQITHGHFLQPRCFLACPLEPIFSYTGPKKWSMSQVADSADFDSANAVSGERRHINVGKESVFINGINIQGWTTAFCRSLLLAYNQMWVSVIILGFTSKLTFIKRARLIIWRVTNICSLAFS